MSRIIPIKNFQNDAFIEVDIDTGYGCHEQRKPDSCGDRLLKHEVKGIKHDQEDIKYDVRSLQTDYKDLTDNQKDLLKSQHVLQDEYKELQLADKTITSNIESLKSDIKSIDKEIESVVQEKISKFAESGLKTLTKAQVTSIADSEIKSITEKALSKFTNEKIIPITKELDAFEATVGQSLTGLVESDKAIHDNIKSLAESDAAIKSDIKYLQKADTTIIKDVKALQEADKTIQNQVDSLKHDTSDITASLQFELETLAKSVDKTDEAAQVNLKALKDSDTSIRADFVKADSAIRTDFAKADKTIQNQVDTLKQDTREITEYLQFEVETLAKSVDATDEAVQVNLKALKDSDTSIRADFVKADTALHNTIKGEFAQADTAIRTDVKALKESDTAIRTEFVKADKTIQNQVDTLKQDTREITEYLQFEVETLAKSVDATDEAVQVNLKALKDSDTSIRADFVKADTALHNTIKGEFAQADTAIRTDVKALKESDTAIRTEFVKADKTIQNQVDTLKKGTTDMTDYLQLEVEMLAQQVVKTDEAVQVNLKALKDSDTAIRTEFANADAAIRKEFVQADKDILDSIDKKVDKITTEHLEKVTDQQLHDLAQKKVEEITKDELQAVAKKQLDSIVTDKLTPLYEADEAIRTDFAKADASVKQELELMLETVARDADKADAGLATLIEANAILSEAGDKSIRAEFAKADSAIKGDVTTLEKSFNDFKKNSEQDVGILQDEIEILSQQAAKQDDAIRTEFAKADSAIKSDVTTIEKSFNDFKKNSEQDVGILQDEIEILSQQAAKQDDAIRTEFAKADSAIIKDVKGLQEADAGLVTLIEVNAALSQEGDKSIRAEFAKADAGLVTLIEANAALSQEGDKSIRAEFAKADSALHNTIKGEFADADKILADRVKTLEGFVKALQDAHYTTQSDIVTSMATKDGALYNTLHAMIKNDSFKDVFQVKNSNLEEQSVNANSTNFDALW